MAAVCFQSMVVHVFEFQPFWFSKLGRLPICVICVTSPSDVCHILCHIFCVTIFVSQFLCLSHCVCHSFCICRIVFVTFMFHIFVIFAKYNNFVKGKVGQLWQVLYGSWAVPTRKNCAGVLGIIWEFKISSLTDYPKFEKRLDLTKCISPIKIYVYQIMKPKVIANNFSQE